jgi:hypothetical protein
MGGIIIGIVCNFTRDIGTGGDSRDTNLQWLIPMALYFMIPTIVLCGTPFIAESPRWLASKGRLDEARANLKRVRVDKSDEALDAEMSVIVGALEAEVSRGQGSYRDLFRGTNSPLFCHLQISTR